MRYVSPAWLFNGELPEKFDQKTIRQRRTQLLADLELTGITLDYRGETLTKNDIIVLFDDFEKEGTLAWHIAIAQDKMLLTFLEDLYFDQWAVTDHYVRYRTNPLYKDEAFIRWISPCYYESFMFYMEMECLRNSNFDALTALLGVPLLMTKEDQQKAWQAVASLVERPIDRIRQYGEKATCENDMLKISHWMEEGFLRLVHLLPEKHFSQTRDRYALAIFDAAQQVRSKEAKYPRLTPIWMQNAIDLASSPELKQQLTARKKKAESPIQNLQRITRIPPHVWIMLLIGLIICYFVGRSRQH